MKSEIQELFDEIRKFDKYPLTMAPICGEIADIAFFPGGKGIYYSENISDRKIMILGQDFGIEKNFIEVVKVGREDICQNQTWRNVLDFLGQCHISPMDCFFTNAILGVRVGDNIKVDGKSPAFKDKEFINYCWEFFLKQLEIQRPDLILVLGLEVAYFLARHTEELYDWRKGGFKYIDDKGLQVRKNVKFQNNITTNLVVLTHPSRRPPNVLHRKFKNFSGNTAEVEMVREGLKN